ncbi:MAG: TRAP transporter TatT component family protein [Gammaproteobacteria bacterium]
MFRKLMFISAMLALMPAAQAARDDALVVPLQDRWAEIKYTLPEKQHAEQYAALAKEAHAVSEANPNVPAVLIWEGIIVSSEAGARGGLGALSLAKQARKLLEESLKLDEGAMNGSAYTSLGTLYAKVPRWPVGFGDKERAEKLFKKALEINPQGIDANFFYGEYLVEHDRVAEGRSHLERALAAPPRPGRELADAGRRREIQALLNNIESDAD